MELLNHPSNSKSTNPQFAGRDWKQIHVGDLVSRDDVRIVDSDMLVEDATKVNYLSFSMSIRVFMANIISATCGFWAP